jgi:hypothetical protein
MTTIIFKKSLLLLAFLLQGAIIISQTIVPMGVSYQAVARDNFGKELANREINVRFSILTGNPQGTKVYQELHSNVITSKYGVFSLVIGKGVPVGGLAEDFSGITWETANHYLKVEIKFENDYIDMGTMQFLSVPYALYAKKSLEPGPQGPKGDPGNPASDDQTLSFDGKNLVISGGNTVNLSSLVNDADADSLNEIQDLRIVNNKLKITKNPDATEINLSGYLDNTDNQALVYDPATRKLGIQNSLTTIDLTELKNDADADPTNEIQTFSYNPENYQLSLSKGGGTATVGQIIAFRAGISSAVNLPDNTPVDLVFNQVSGVYYNDGGIYNTSTGGFTAPFNGIYSFSVSINLPANSSVIIRLAGNSYETIIGPETSSGLYKAGITMKLNKNDIINVAVLQTNGYTIPSYSFTGYFSGYRIY